MWAGNLYHLPEFSGAHQNFSYRNFQKQSKEGSNLCSSALQSDTLTLRHSRVDRLLHLMEYIPETQFLMRSKMKSKYSSTPPVM
jgi:hypothetical protein